MDEPYAQILHKYGLKSTKTRRLVIGVLSHSTRVLTVDEVYDSLLTQSEKVTFSTIYRILEMLAAKQVVDKSFFPDSKKYGYILRQHQHTHRLICLGCHKIIDLPHCPLGVYTDSVAQETGFSIVSHKLELYGYCTECQKKKTSELR